MQGLKFKIHTITTYKSISVIVVLSSVIESGNLNQVGDKGQ